MNTGTDNSFADLEDAAEWDKPMTIRGDHAQADISDPDVAALTLGTGVNEATVARYEGPCFKCKGTGQFIGWSGRALGDCYTCKGSGKMMYKTSPETRAARKAYTAERKAKAAAKKAETVRLAREAWMERNADVVQYLRTRSDHWSFAASMLDSLGQYGSLTERQLTAVRNCMDKDAVRDAQREAARKADNPETDLDLSDVQAGRYAVPDGDTRLKILIKRPNKASRWHGHTFVSDAAEYGARQTYGRQAPGSTYTGKCVEQLRAIVADPLEAMVAYGRLTGTCGKCGRPLEDKESVARGIGPICAGKMG